MAVSQPLDVVEIMFRLVRVCGGADHSGTDCGRWRRLLPLCVATVADKAAIEAEFRVAAEATNIIAAFVEGLIATTHLSSQD